MSEAAVGDKALRLRHRVAEILRAVHRENGRELFMRELLADVDAFDLADQYLRLLRYADAGERGYFEGALPYDRRVERAVDDDRLAHLLRLPLVQQIAASGRELRPYFVINRVKYDDRLLRSADHAVVEGLRVDD